MNKLVVVFLLIYTAVFSQIEIVYEVENNNNEKTFNYLYLSKENFAMKSDNEDKRIVFNGSENIMYVINNKKKDYIEINKDDISNLAEKINQMNKMMEEQMAQMPEGQREKVKGMMESNMPAKKAKKMHYEYKKSNESKEINGYPTAKYEVYLNNAKEEQDLWVTDYKNIELKKDDFGAFLEFKEFMTEIFESIGNMGDVDYEMLWDFNELDGFPVRNVFFDDSGNIKETHILKSVKRNINDESVFEVPQSYKKKEMNF